MCIYISQSKTPSAARKMNLKRFDLFPKLKEESRRSTNEGGIISIIGIVFGGALLFSEIWGYFTPLKIEQLELFDPHHTSHVPNALSIHLELEFLHLTCDQLVVSVSSETTTEDYAGSWTIQDKQQQTNGNEGCLLNAQVLLEKYESGEMHVSLSPHVLENSVGDQVGFTIEEYFKFNTSHHLKVSWGLLNSHCLTSV